MGYSAEETCSTMNYPGRSIRRCGDADEIHRNCVNKGWDPPPIESLRLQAMEVKHQVTWRSL